MAQTTYPVSLIRFDSPLPGIGPTESVSDKTHELRFIPALRAFTIASKTGKRDVRYVPASRVIFWRMCDDAE